MRNPNDLAFSYASDLLDILNQAKNIVKKEPNTLDVFEEFFLNADIRNHVFDQLPRAQDKDAREHVLETLSDIRLGKYLP